MSTTRTTRKDLLELAAKIAKNLKVASGQLRELERAIATLPGDESDFAGFTCERCVGGLELPSHARLEEHIRNVHGASDSAIGTLAVVPPRDDDRSASA